MQKFCNKCKKLKLFSDFHRDRSKEDGYRTTCKECKSLSDKNYKQKDRKEAMVLLNMACENVCKKHGGKFLFYWGNNKKYNNTLENLGFIEGDKDYSHLIKRI